MAATNYTPIQLYRTATASAAPVAANLSAGELAINYNDGVLYYKDSSGVVKVLAKQSGITGSGTTNYVPKFTSSSVIGNSVIYDDGTNVGIGSTGAVNKLDVNGNIGLVGSTAMIGIDPSTQYFTFLGRPTAQYGMTLAYYSGLTNPGTALFGFDAVILGTSATERMRIDSSGNVGIGTNNPIGKLSVSNGLGDTGFNYGTFAAPNRGNLWYDTDGTGWKFQIGKVQSSAFTAQMTFVDSGNVGIGTSSPNSRLDVRFANLTSPTQLNHILLQSLATGSTSQIGARTGITFNNRTQQYSDTGGTSTSGIYGVDEDTDVYGRYMGLAFYTSTIDATASERMRIDSNGNVGIGTSSPAEKLDISSGNVVVRVDGDGSTGGKFIIDGTNASGFYTYLDATGLYTDNGSGIDVINFPGGAAATTLSVSDISHFSSATISSGLTIGSVYPFAGSNSIFIQQDSDTGGLGNTAISITNYSLTKTLQISNNTIWTSGTGTILAFGTVNAERMRIDASGYALIGYTSSNGAYKLQVNSQIFATSSTIATSDGNYKENVMPLNNALDLVCALNPVSFDWKQHPVHNFDRSTTTTGFIAQEVQQALQNTEYVNAIVKTNTCVLEPEEQDQDGNVTKPAVTEEFLGIAEGNLIALLTASIKELKAELDTVKSQLATLQGN